MDSDPGRLPPDDGPSNPNPNPRPDPEPKPQECAQEERLSSLTLEDSCNATGAPPPSSNGSLPVDFYFGDEIEEEEPAAASDSVERAAEDARASSSHGGVVSRENLEQDGDASPSPSSSGYAGERGSSGESGIEEVRDGRTSPDDWSYGKEHLDEASSAILCFLFCGF